MCSGGGEWGWNWRGGGVRGKAALAFNRGKHNYDIVFMKKLLTKRKRYAKMVATSDNRDARVDFCAETDEKTVRLR